MKKKAQVWTLDFVTGLLMFIVILFLALAVIRNNLANTSNYESALRDSDHISAMLVGEGFPNDWNSSNVIIPGIAENNRINFTKLNSFDELTYEKQKLLFQNTGDFLFYFYNGTVINESKCFWGYPLAGCNLAIPSNAENVAKTERVVILNSTITKLIIITWN
ncbi:MAG: hypothetical protein ACP5N3_01875 [Candidatus Nanoarchaeia archaeon]